MPDKNDPMEMWQNQTVNGTQVGLAAIRQRTRELHAKTRRDLFVNIAMLPVVAGFGIFGFLKTNNLPLRCVFLLAMAWAAVGLWFVQRGAWSSEEPGDAAFYRQQLELRLYLFRRVLRWSFGPLLLSVSGFVAVVAGLGPLRRAMPFCSLFAIWIVSFLMLQVRAQRALRQELNELKKGGTITQ